MKDSTTTLQQLKNICNEFVSEREWHQFHAPKNLSMAIAVEAAELMEKFMWVGVSASRGLMKNGDQKFKQEVQDELADVIAASLMFANACEIDVVTALENKMVQNRKKYPIEKARGLSAKYTELK